jgi:4-amino-4-deoxy-L-arabinose transferase-like glycosyltransferase
VSDSNHSHFNKRWAKTAEKIGWAILVVATLYVSYFSHLGAIGFVGPDEPRYAWIARDMAETGDWVTPRLYGKPWFEKPPLYYWGAALSFKIFGVSEAAARLPSAISALLATLALAWLAWRIYGLETARWLALILPTTVGMIGFSHAAATDMPFSAMLTIAMVCAAVALRLVPRRDSGADVALAADGASANLGRAKTPWLALILFGFFLGAAVLAKGPAGIMLSGGAVFFWALFSRRWRDAFRMFHPAAVASFCVTALPWYVLCARRNPDFFRIFIIEHNFKRYLTPEFQHIQPFWFYVPITLLALLPWTLLIFAPLKDGWRAWNENRWRNSPGMYFACWALFTLTFFSVSQSKLPGYILPALFPLAVLWVQAISHRSQGRGGGPRWTGFACGAAILGVLLAVNRIPFVVDYFPPGPLPWVYLFDLLAVIAVVALGLRRWTSLVITITVISVLVTLDAGLSGDARWALDLGVSARGASRVPKGTSLDYWRAHAATYKLQRSYRYALNFYLHEELGDWKGDTSQQNWVFSTPKEMPELLAKGLDCPHFIAYPAVIVCEAGDSRDRLHGGGEGGVGSN